VEQPKWAVNAFNEFQNRCICYVLGSFGIGIMLFLLWKEASTATYFSSFMNAFMASNARVVFTVSLLCFILPAMFNTNGILRGVFTNKIWKPLGRISYTFYLLHVMIILCRNHSNQKSPYIGAYFLFQEWLIICVYAFAISVPTYLLIELPLKRLEDNILLKNFMVKNYDESRVKYA